MKPAHLNDMQIKSARCTTIYQVVLLDLINLGIITKEDLKKIPASVPQKYIKGNDESVAEDDEE